MLLRVSSETTCWTWAGSPRRATWPKRQASRQCRQAGRTADTGANPVCRHQGRAPPAAAAYPHSRPAAWSGRAQSRPRRAPGPPLSSQWTPPPAPGPAAIERGRGANAQGARQAERLGAAGWIAPRPLRTPERQDSRQMPATQRPRASVAGRISGSPRPAPHAACPCLRQEAICPHRPARAHVLAEHVLRLCSLLLVILELALQVGVQGAVVWAASLARRAASRAGVGCLPRRAGARAGGASARCRAWRCGAAQRGGVGLAGGVQVVAAALQQLAQRVTLAHHLGGGGGGAGSGTGVSGRPAQCLRCRPASTAACALARVVPTCCSIFSVLRRLVRRSSSCLDSCSQGWGVGSP